MRAMIWRATIHWGSGAYDYYVTLQGWETCQRGRRVMRGLRPFGSPRGRLLLCSAIALIAGVGARAAVPVTSYVVIQPIDVCGTTGPTSTTGCAPFNDQTQSPD